MTKREEYLRLVTQMQKPHQEAVKTHLAIQQQVGQRAQTVVQHEGWQTFLDHLEQVRTNLTERQNRLRDELLGPDPSALARQEYRELVGEIRGLTTAISIIPRLIEAGVEAKAILETK